MRSFISNTLLLTTLLFVAVSVCSSEPDHVTELEQQIQTSKQSQKVDAIIAYMKVSFFFKSKLALAYGEQALKLLERYPNNRQAALVYLYMARAVLYEDDLSQAKIWAMQSEKIAQRSGLGGIEASAALVRGEIAFTLRDYEQAKKLISFAIERSNQVQDRAVEGRAHGVLGKLYKSLLQYDLSLRHYLQGLDIYLKLNDRLSASKSHEYLASLYRKMGVFEKTLLHQREALKMARALEDNRSIAVITSNLGTYYKDVRDYERAIEMHQESLRIKHTLNYQRGIIHSYNQLGNLHYLAGDLESAEYYITQAITLAGDLEKPTHVASAYLYLGRVYRVKGDMSLAESHLLKSLELFRKSFREASLAKVRLELARLYTQNEALEKAIIQLDNAERIASLHGSEALLTNIYREQSDVYKATGDYNAALMSLHSYLSLSEVLAERSKQHRIQSLIIEHDLEDKALAIESLTQENKIKALELEQQKIQNRLYLIGLMLVFLVLFFLYNWRAKNTQLKIEAAALQKVKTANRRLSLALWGSGDTLWDWDLVNGIMVRENQLEGLRLPPEVIGTHIDVFKPLVHPDDFEELKQRFTDHLQGRSEFYEVSYRVLTNTGDWLWILDRGRVTERSEHGDALRLSGTFKNISKIKASEYALSELNASLEQRVEERTETLKRSRDELAMALEELTKTQEYLFEARKMAALGRLVVGVSHELNTPLGTSVTANSLLKDKFKQFQSQLNESTLTRNDTEQFMEVASSCITLLEANITRAAELVQRFKLICVDDGSQPEQRFMMSDLLAGFQTLHRSDDKVTVHCDCPADLAITSDRQTLSTVLEGLYQNSVDHGFVNKTEGNIWIQVKICSQKVILYFSDDGEGIESESASSLFDPFYTTKRHDGHVGLGLYIVFSQVTHLLRGQITYQARSEGGACFVIQIPQMIETS
ncbi:hypothetical protein PRUB_b0239 [Pseudoalteromonas rubra]|uniref:histidine kinase n=1 Tax=Pseudoalteromonas rubra TaxID=43658 RepID=A0A8T0C1J7_9GAMM|nr:tetratricopeptide repeat protein [Pseudoalteromonas rubra]KAF7781118.1 hypothetical protein PRUB_b0239 [Pseudoalteromonas rubra]